MAEKCVNRESWKPKTSILAQLQGNKRENAEVERHQYYNHYGTVVASVMFPPCCTMQMPWKLASFSRPESSLF